MEIRLVRAGLLRAHGRTERQTGRTNLLVAFRNFANAPEIGRMREAIFKKRDRNIKRYK